MSLAAGLLLLFLSQRLFSLRSRSMMSPGLLLAVDPSRHTITVSCKEIAGYMEAMVMSFRVKDATLPESLQPGVMVDFTLVVDNKASFAEGIHVRPFESLELDPTEARRLKLIENASSARPPSADVLHLGDLVAGFSVDRSET